MNHTSLHIGAERETIADTVLMPGDPMRSRFIAEHYLEHAELVSNVRGIQGYTGTYRGKRVTVMASGMGMPSMGIYSYELYHFYGVDAIIRIGSAGALADGLRLRDLVIGMGACTDGNYAEQFRLRGAFAPSRITVSSAARRSCVRKRRFRTASAISCPAISFTTTGKISQSGGISACWRWRWRQRRSISTPPAQGKRRSRSARSATRFLRGKSAPQRSGNAPLRI